MSHQFGKRPYRQLRTDDDDIRENGKQRDWLEILLGIVTELAVERPVGRERADRAHHQRVAVRRCPGARESSDIAAGAPTIVDHEALANDLLTHSSRLPRTSLLA